MLVASTCPVCGQLGAAPCAGCRSALQPVGPVWPPPAGTDGCVALFAYEGAGRAVIAGLKFRNERSTVAWLGRALAEQVRVEPDFFAVDGVVTWIPTTTARRHARGFDQAALVARATAMVLGRPARQLLTRRAGPAQTGRTRLERLVGPQLRARSLIDRPVLVIDDVLTTGASVASAAEALRVAGAPSVVAAVTALTPDSGSSHRRSGPKEVIHPLDP